MSPPLTGGITELDEDMTGLDDREGNLLLLMALVFVRTGESVSVRLMTSKGLGAPRLCIGCNMGTGTKEELPGRG